MLRYCQSPISPVSSAAVIYTIEEPKKRQFLQQWKGRNWERTITSETYPRTRKYDQYQFNQLYCLVSESYIFYQFNHS